MPNRVFSDKAWQSDKLKDLSQDCYRAEYAWIYSLALCDGTFECDPKKVWSACYTYARDGWTVRKVAEMLDDFARVGLLLRATDEEGKVWGFWFGCETTLPPRAHWAKYKRGKGYLFSQPAVVRTTSGQGAEDVPSGIGLGSGSGNGIGSGAAPTGSAGDDHYPSSTKVNMVDLGVLDADAAAACKLTPIASGVDHNGRKEGEPGYFCRGQYHGTNPKHIHKAFIAAAWEKYGPGNAVAYYPSKWPEKWEAAVAQAGADLLVPAFELWTVEVGMRTGTNCPAGEFAKVVNEYIAKIKQGREAVPRITQQQVDATNTLAKERHDALWTKPAEAAVPEPSDFLEEEKS